MSTKDDLYLPAGSLLMTSAGEYSDYHTSGCFVTLEPLYRSKMQELRDEVVKDDAREEAMVEATYEAWEKRRLASPADAGEPPPSRHNSDRHELFIAAMIRKGWLMSVTYTELHLGSYGVLDLVL